MTGPQVGEAGRPTKVYQGIEALDPPEFRHDHAELRAMAEQLLESRRKRFPGLVDAGKLAADAAARQLELFEQIAKDWRWICTGEGSPAPIVTLFDRTEAIDESLRTVAAIAGERGGFDARLQHQAHCLIAIRWHLEPGRDASLHATVSLTHELRARAKQQRALAEKETARVH